MWHIQNDRSITEKNVKVLAVAIDDHLNTVIVRSKHFKLTTCFKLRSLCLLLSLS